MGEREVNSIARRLSFIWLFGARQLGKYLCRIDTRKDWRIQRNWGTYRSYYSTRYFPHQHMFWRPGTGYSIHNLIINWKIDFDEMANQRASAKFSARLNSYVQLVARPKVSNGSLELKKWTQNLKKEINHPKLKVVQQSSIVHHSTDHLSFMNW